MVACPAGSVGQCGSLEGSVQPPLADIRLLASCVELERGLPIAIAATSLGSYAGRIARYKIE